MRTRMKNVLETLIRVKSFQSTDGLPTNPLATTLFTQVTTVATELEDYGTDQESGRCICAGGTDDRQRFADDLREKIRPISRTTKALDPEQFPGAAAQFRMPRKGSYQALLTSTRAMLEHIGTVKAALIARGFAANFDEDIQTAMAVLEAATDRKFEGLGKQAGGTSGMADAASRGLKHLKELDAIMRNVLKTNPALLGSWLTVSHVQRGPVREESSTPAPTTPATPPPAPAG